MCIFSEQNVKSPHVILSEIKSIEAEHENTVLLATGAVSNRWAEAHHPERLLTNFYPRTAAQVGTMINNVRIIHHLMHISSLPKAVCWCNMQLFDQIMAFAPDTVDNPTLAS